MPETLETLTRAIDNILLDGCLDFEGIKDMVNRAVEGIAGGGIRGYSVPPLQPLPLLETVFSVSTVPGLNSVSMPEGYQRDGARQVWDIQGGFLTRYEDLIKFRSDNVKDFGKVGNVKFYCLSGRTFHYSPSPSVASVLSVTGYRYPQKMDNDTDTPDGIPPHLQYELLVNYPAFHFWNYKDQDQDRSLHNIGKHKMLFYEALDNLDIFLKESMPAYNVEANQEQFMIT